jgi:hypothetical protein
MLHTHTHTHTYDEMEYYSTMKKNEIMSLAGKWMVLGYHGVK